MTHSDANLSAGGEPDTVATPEGDGEVAADAPLSPGSVESSVKGLQRPRGNAPAAYESDLKEGESHTPTGLEKLIDEISHGTLLP